MEWLTEARRAYVYRLVTVLVPLLAALGWVGDGLARQIPLVAAAVLAVGGAGMAARHTPTRRQRRRRVEQ